MRKNMKKNQRQGLTLAQHIRDRKRSLFIERTWNCIRHHSSKLPEGWLATPNML